MTQNTHSREEEFCNRIDCNFPYLNIEQCEKLVDEAISISDNAVFTVKEELARIPYTDRSKISQYDLKYLLGTVSSKFNHPLLKEIISVAEMLIEEKEITINEATELMNKIAAYKGLWGALSIAYSSSDDQVGVLDERYDSIRDEWNKNEP